MLSLRKACFQLASKLELEEAVDTDPATVDIAMAMVPRIVVD